MFRLPMILLSLFFAALVGQVVVFSDVQTSPQGQRNISLSVGITDHKGNALADIRPDEIAVYEDGIQQKIISSTLESGPLSIGILLDVSSSQKKHFSAVWEAVKSFLANSARESEFFIITFGEEIRTLSDFADQQTTLSRLTPSLPEKRSKVYDAIHYGLAKAQQGKFARRALLLITNGQENGSRISYRDLFREIKKNETQIYCLGVGNTNSDGGDGPGNFQIGHLLLEELAKLTGGTAYDKDKPEQLIAEANLIAQQMKHQYRVVYPRSFTKNKWQKVKVQINSTRKVKARTREGYYPN